MTNTKRFLVPLYMGAAVLALLPMLELVQATWPFRPGDSAWRVITVGLISRVVATPLLALIIIHAVAMMQGSKATLRSFAMLNFVFSFILLAALAMFFLDALEVRTNIAANARDTYEMGVLLSAVKLGIALILLVTLAIAQWKAAADMKRSARAAAQAPLYRSGKQRPEEREEVAATASREPAE
jgi:hypothetical protein